MKIVSRSNPSGLEVAWRKGVAASKEAVAEVQDALQPSSSFLMKQKAKMESEMKRHWSTVKEAPMWTKSLLLTDWVSLVTFPPIIAGLVVFSIYLVQAQNDFHEMLDLMNASGGLTKLINAYSIFLGVTAPLVSIGLVYALGMVFIEHHWRLKVQRDHSLTAAPVNPIGTWAFRLFRGLLMTLIVLEYLGLLWLILCTAATAILLVAAFATEAAANGALSYVDTTIGRIDTAMDWIHRVNVTHLQEVAYQTNVDVNGMEMNVGEMLDAIVYTALNRSVVLETIGQIVKSTCPDFCLDVAFLKSMLDLDSINECICTPEVIYQLRDLAIDSQGELIAALIGIIVMVVAWIVLLMRLAATHDVVRVKYKLQQWLVSQGYGDPAARNLEGTGAVEPSGEGSQGPPEPGGASCTAAPGEGSDGSACIKDDNSHP